MWIKISDSYNLRNSLILGYTDFVCNICFMYSLQKWCSKNNGLKYKAWARVDVPQVSPSALLMDLSTTYRTFLSSLARHCCLRLSCATPWYNHMFCKQKMSASAIHILALYHINNDLNLPLQSYHPSSLIDRAMHITLKRASISMGYARLQVQIQRQRNPAENSVLFSHGKHWKPHWKFRRIRYILWVSAGVGPNV